MRSLVIHVQASLPIRTLNSSVGKGRLISLKVYVKDWTTNNEIYIYIDVQTRRYYRANVMYFLLSFSTFLHVYNDIRTTSEWENNCLHLVQYCISCVTKICSVYLNSGPSNIWIGSSPPKHFTLPAQHTKAKCKAMCCRSTNQKEQEKRKKFGPSTPHSYSTS